MKRHQTLTAKSRPPSTPDQTSVAAVPAAVAPAEHAACDDGKLRQELIAVQAYFLAEARGFTPGSELDDWLAAESLVDARVGASTAAHEVEPRG